MSAKVTKTCFVVGPIGDEHSNDRIHADWLFEEIIEKVFQDHFPEFTVTRADKIAEPGRIDAQVITALLDSDLVVADLSTLNPNAFYEIGIRHMTQKPIVHVHLEGERIPFDIGTYRSIKFSLKTPFTLRKARTELEAAIRAATSDGHNVDNPVTVARGKIEFVKSASSTEKVLFSELQTLKDRVSLFERNLTTTGIRSFARPERFRIDLSPASVQATSDFLRGARSLIENHFAGYEVEDNGSLAFTCYVANTVETRVAVEALKKEASNAEYSLVIS